MCVCVCVCAQVGRGAERAPRPSLPHGGSTTAPHKYNNQIRRRASLGYPWRCRMTKALSTMTTPWTNM